MLVLNLTIGILILLLGLAFGSFLNVCIARLPRHESIVHPPSHCPRCNTPIQVSDNIPLLSYLLLRGHCRTCHASISWRYPAVELVTACLWLACFLVFGFTAESVAMAILSFLALGLAIMDAETFLLPDAFTLPGIALGILWAAVGTDGIWSDKLRAASLSALWAIIAAALILLIRAAYWLVRKREGMGLGDAKLLAMIAAWLGPANALLVLFLGVIGAAIFGIALVTRQRKKNRTSRVPLGAFLCIATLYAIFFGPQTIHWYLGFFA